MIKQVTKNFQNCLQEVPRQFFFISFETFPSFDHLSFFSCRSWKTSFNLIKFLRSTTENDKIQKMSSWRYRIIKETVRLLTQTVKKCCFRQIDIQTESLIILIKRWKLKPVKTTVAKKIQKTEINKEIIIRFQGHYLHFHFSFYCVSYYCGWI